MSQDCGLTRSDRVRRRGEFERAYAEGSRVRGRFMTLFVVPTAASHRRLGVAATRKLGPAIDRNRAKRLARELFRRHKFRPEMPAGVDIIVVPRREMLDASFASLEADYTMALGRVNRGREAARKPRDFGGGSGAA